MGSRIMQNNQFKPTQISPRDLDKEHVPPHHLHIWDGLDRRQTPRENDDEPLTKGEFEKRISSFRHYTAEAINTRFALFEEKILERIDELDRQMKAGFPDGDPDLHRKDHETRIRLDNEKAELYKSVREKVITSGIWGAFVLILMALWEYAKSNIGK